MPNPKKSGKDWSIDDVAKLKHLARINTSTPRIANRLGRSEVAVRNKASQLKVSLKPKDKKVK